MGFDDVVKVELGLETEVLVGWVTVAAVVHPDGWLRYHLLEGPDQDTDETARMLEQAMDRLRQRKSS